MKNEERERERSSHSADWRIVHRATALVWLFKFDCIELSMYIRNARV